MVPRRLESVSLNKAKAADEGEKRVTRRATPPALRARSRAKRMCDFL